VKPADAARAVVIISARTLHGGDLTIVTTKTCRTSAPTWVVDVAAEYAA